MTDRQLSTAMQAALARMSITLVGESVDPVDASRDRPWPHDLWLVSIYEGSTVPGQGGCGRVLWTTQYKTGIGLRGKLGRAIKPDPLEVLHCLFMDAQAAGLSFHDWASDYGYSTDSIKALEIYQACCATGLHLRTVFNKDYRTLKEELQEMDL